MTQKQECEKGRQIIGAHETGALAANPEGKFMEGKRSVN